MGDFGKPSTTSVPGFSGAQGQVQGDLARVLSDLLGSDIGGAFRELLSGAPTDISGIEQSTFDTFNRRAVPAINAQASGLSATQNSRRIDTIAQAAGDVTSQLSRLQAQMTESARNRQLQAVFGPLGISSGFSTARTTDTIAEPSPFSQLAGLGGTLGGAALGK